MTTEYINLIEAARGIRALDEAIMLEIEERIQRPVNVEENQ